MDKSKSTLVSKHIHFRIYQDEVINKAGLAEVHEYVWRKDGTRTICIDSDANVLLQKEFRYELNDFDWRIPGGRLNSETEELVIAAQREFREETGFAATDWNFLWSTTPDSTVRYQRHFFLATGDISFVGDERDSGENIEVHWIPIVQANEMALMGKIREEISALAIARIFFSKRFSA